jgi:hypothetical protein
MQYLFLLFVLSLTHATPSLLTLRSFPPAPLFTVAAFQQPYPPGSNLTGSLGISGVPLRALGGAFWINPASASTTPPTVLYVNTYRETFLVLPFLFLPNPQKSFLQPQDLTLSTLSTQNQLRLKFNTSIKAPIQD